MLLYDRRNGKPPACTLKIESAHAGRLKAGETRMTRVKAATHDAERQNIRLDGYKMTTYRTIYKIEGISKDGCLVFRRFARNKKTAEKIKRHHKNGRAYYIGVELVPKFDHWYINPADVE